MSASGGSSKIEILLYSAMTNTARPSAIWVDRAWLADGWAERVRLSLSAEGDITAIEKDAEPGDAERVGGIAIPGMPNAHGHAFQRAMAGLAEHAGASADSFWTWREAMYRLALAVTGLLPPLLLSKTMLSLGLVFAVFVGAVSGLIPGIGAMRMRVVNALRRV